MSNDDKDGSELEATWEDKSVRIRTFRAVVALCVTAVVLVLIWAVK